MEEFHAITSEEGKRLLKAHNTWEKPILELAPSSAVDILLSETRISFTLESGKSVFLEWPNA